MYVLMWSSCNWASHRQSSQGRMLLTSVYSRGIMLNWATYGSCRRRETRVVPMVE
jgi:hypothetical protein